MNDLIRKEDLETNPTPRVPICLCLDVSGSMGRVVDGQTRDTGKREFSDGKWWRLVEGGVTALQELKGGVNLFYDNLLEDDVARYAAEICIVTFGTKAELVMDFANLDRQESERKAKIDSLTAQGETPMGEAVKFGFGLLREAQG